MNPLPVLALTALPLSSATVVDLDFDSLPTGQGWVLDKTGPHADDAESDLFEATGSSLNQTTVGVGQGSGWPGQATYRREVDPASVEDDRFFTIEWTAAVTAHEQTRQDFSYAPFRVSASLLGDSVTLGVKPGELRVLPGGYFTPTDFDGTVSNDYRLVVDAEANAYELFLNGGSVATGATSATSASAAYLGDGTGTANADGTTTRLRVTTAVPEPSALALLILSAAGLLRRRR